MRGQLAGLTMKLRNPSNGFAQRYWPASVQWINGGTARYTMDPDIAEMWRRVRQADAVDGAAE